ncbi:uncharacterized protein LOC125494789 [Beta vulgaris subsp. vulgaris]|uniref:uncharacterized protein LOC125494789 n=1 Tax=Beta vulgaris subsp. vulgaris TaxID=3555 RepID=UPI0020373938|nr:uncharacterized protein LOC125494789 [Beta vulgaris subsp. vulgaris]
MAINTQCCSNTPHKSTLLQSEINLKFNQETNEKKKKVKKPNYKTISHHQHHHSTTASDPCPTPLAPTSTIVAGYLRVKRRPPAPAPPLLSRRSSSSRPVVRTSPATSFHHRRCTPHRLAVAQSLFVVAVRRRRCSASCLSTLLTEQRLKRIKDITSLPRLSSLLSRNSGMEEQLWI